MAAYLGGDDVARCVLDTSTACGFTRAQNWTFAISKPDRAGLHPRVWGGPTRALSLDAHAGRKLTESEGVPSPTL